MGEQRHRDRKFLNTFHEQRCVACGTFGCDPAHIQSKGAHGGDEWWNVLPLCRGCHSGIQHQNGWMRLIERHPSVGYALEARGWVVEEVLGKRVLVRCPVSSAEN